MEKPEIPEYFSGFTPSQLQNIGSAARNIRKGYAFLNEIFYSGEDPNASEELSDAFGIIHSYAQGDSPELIADRLQNDNTKRVKEVLKAVGFTEEELRQG